MTQDEAAETPELDPAELQLPDPQLVTLVELANRGALELGLRLFVGGLVLSGTLVGGPKYFDSLADSFEDNGVEGEGLAAFADLYRNIAGDYRSRAEEEKVSERSSPTEYIHLIDAWSYSPGQAPLIVGLWRGRMSRVDGWSIGTYSPSPRQPE